MLLFRGWGLESRIGAESQARMKSLTGRSRRAKKKLDPYYPFIHGVKDSDHPVNIQLALRGNPENLGPEVPRHFLSVFSHGDPAPFTEGSGRMELAELILKQPIAMRVIVNRIWKAHFGTGIVDTPEQFRLRRGAAHRSGAARIPCQRFREERDVDQKAAARDHAELAFTSFRRTTRKSLPRRIPATASTGAPTASGMDAEQLRDSILMSPAIWTIRSAGPRTS